MKEENQKRLNLVVYNIRKGMKVVDCTSASVILISINYGSVVKKEEKW